VIDLNRSMMDLMARGKGILAADESIATMSSRLANAGVAPTQHNRRAYREMLVTAPGLPDAISGVILCDETFRQRLSSGATFPQALAETGILPGIKVDTGAKPLAGRPGETVTEGLDGLRGRLAEYAGLGARFAKWRAVIVIADGCPSWQALRANAHALARYATLCQEARIVPIVEPEVLMTGAHSMDQCAKATTATLMAVFAELQEFDTGLDAIVLKPNMVVPGEDAIELTTPDEVARATLNTLRTILPEQTGGVAFLSGGQPPGRAAANLAAIRSLPAPWPVTFSFGRALVDPALAAWRGEPDRGWAGQQALARQVAACSAALSGNVGAAAGTGNGAAGTLVSLPAPRPSDEPANRPGAKVRVVPVRPKIPFLKPSGAGNGARAWRHAHAEAARQRRDDGR
jgi:fructose-bisphosphate aldolase class I